MSKKLFWFGMDEGNLLKWWDQYPPQYPFQDIQSQRQFSIFYYTFKISNLCLCSYCNCDFYCCSWSAKSFRYHYKGFLPTFIVTDLWELQLHCLFDRPVVDRPTQLICICQQSVGNLLIQHTWFQGNCCRSSGCKIELHEPTKDQETYCTQLDPIWTYLMYGRWIQCKPVVMSAPREAIIPKWMFFTHCFGIWKLP